MQLGSIYPLSRFLESTSSSESIFFLRVLNLSLFSKDFSSASNGFDFEETKGTTEMTKLDAKIKIQKSASARDDIAKAETSSDPWSMSQFIPKLFCDYLSRRANTNAWGRKNLNFDATFISSCKIIKHKVFLQIPPFRKCWSFSRGGVFTKSQSERRLRLDF